jgi:hypothetical protein
VRNHVDLPSKNIPVHWMQRYSNSRLKIRDACLYLALCSIETQCMKMPRFGLEELATGWLKLAEFGYEMALEFLAEHTEVIAALQLHFLWSLHFLLFFLFF